MLFQLRKFLVKNEFLIISFHIWERCWIDASKHLALKLFFDRRTISGGDRIEHIRDSFAFWTVAPTAGSHARAQTCRVACSGFLFRLTFTSVRCFIVETRTCNPRYTKEMKTVWPESRSKGLDRGIARPFDYTIFWQVQRSSSVEASCLVLRIDAKPRWFIRQRYKIVPDKSPNLFCLGDDIICWVVNYGIWFVVATVYKLVV